MNKELDEMDKKFSKILIDIQCKIGAFNDRIDILEKQTRKLFATKEEKSSYSYKDLVKDHLYKELAHLHNEHGITKEVSMDIMIQ